MLLLSSLICILWSSLTCVEAVTYGRNHVPVRKDNEAVASNFRNISIELLSPAFLSPLTIAEDFRTGKASPTSESDLNHFIRSLSIRNDWMTYSTLDFKSEDGRAIPTLFLSASSRSNVESSSSRAKLRVWLQAAVHGNEPAGDQALLALIGRMDANQSWAKSLLDKMDIFVLPRYNPDGVAAFQRTLLSNFDLNRDHIKLARQQTRDIKNVFAAFAPHVAVDMHEYSASAQYGGTYLQASDGLYSAAKNLNIHPSIRRLSEELFASGVARDLESAGLRWEPYVTGAMENSTIVFTEAGSDGKIGRNAMGLSQCITFLTESRGIGIADQEFQRRTAASLTMVQSILQTAADNADEVYEIVEDAIEEFSASNEDIIITDFPKPQMRTFSMVNSQSGNVEQVPIRFLSTTPTTQNLTRPRPEAYLIPKAWSDLASRLVDSGLVVETIRHTYKGPVQAYNITSVSIQNTYFEGVVPVTATAEVVTRDIELDVGAFWISTRQKNAALAFIAVEPENIDSWVSFNIIPVGVGDQLPIFRVMG